MVVSPDRQPDRALYKVTVALRLVDRLLADLDLGVAPLADERLVKEVRQPGELTGRVAHALMLAEGLNSDTAGQLRSMLRGVLLDLERRAPVSGARLSEATH